MSTPVLCDSPIEGLIVRITLLDSCGVPITGSGSAQITMDGFTLVSQSPQYDIGDRKITRKANGTLCQNYKIKDQFTNFELTTDFCVWNPGLISTMLGARLLTGSSSPTGTGFAYGTSSNDEPAHWSQELWQAPPQACDASGVAYYPYHAWPHLSDAKFGDTAYGPDPSMLQIIGNTYDGSPLWTVGSTYLTGSSVEVGDHWLRNLQNTAPPPDACVLQTYPNT